MDSILSLYKQHKSEDGTKLFWIKSQPRRVHSVSRGPSLGCASWLHFRTVADQCCQVPGSVLPGSSLPKLCSVNSCSFRGSIAQAWLGILSIPRPNGSFLLAQGWPRSFSIHGRNWFFLLVSTRTFLVCSDSHDHCFWFPS